MDAPGVRGGSGTGRDGPWNVAEQIRRNSINSPAWFRATAWVIGLVLLVVWCSWWANSVRRDKLVSGHRTWVPVFRTLACDFIHNIDHPSRIWMAGGDPYRNDEITFLYPYPPLVHRLFSWSSLLTPRRAMVTWIITLSLIAIAGACTSWKTRSALGLQSIPLPLIVVSFLFSTPVVFAVERGNCDLLVVLFVLVSLKVMKQNSWFAAMVAGALLAAAAWTKVYPGLLLVGLIALRRWRVLLGFLVAGAAIGLADMPGFARFVENNHTMTAIAAAEKYKWIHVFEHSLSGCWIRFWDGTELVRIPKTLAAALLLLPLLLWISARVYRCQNRDRLAYPYLVWLLALATYLPPIANDYNLIYLPLAILAVWDERDPVPVHMVMGMLLLWWQPFLLPIDGKLLLVIKYFSLIAVSVSLAGGNPPAISHQGELQATQAGVALPC